MARRSKTNPEPKDPKLLGDSSSKAHAQAGFGKEFVEPILKNVSNSPVYGSQDVRPFIRYASKFTDPTKALLLLHNFYVRLSGTAAGMKTIQGLGGSPGKIVKYLNKAKGIPNGDNKALEQCLDGMSG